MTLPQDDEKIAELIRQVQAVYGDDWTPNEEDLRRALLDTTTHGGHLRRALLDTTTHGGDFIRFLNVSIEESRKP